MTRIRLPRPTKTTPPSKKTTGATSDSARLGGSKTAPGNAQAPPSPPDSPLDSAGWQKSAKLARRRSPPKNPQQEGGGVSASVFTPLSQDDPLEEDREPGLGNSVTEIEVEMGDSSSTSMHLKRSRSPVSRGRKLTSMSRGEREEIGEGVSGEKSSNLGGDLAGSSEEGSASIPMGHRLSESWKASLLPMAFKPGHTTLHSTPTASSATAKKTTTSTARRLEDGKLRLKAMMVQASDQLKLKAGEGDELPGGHA